MANKINLDGEVYSLEDLSDVAKSTLTSYQFAALKIKELNNMLALLQRAKSSYMDSLKKEMLSDKAGFLFDDG